MRGPKDWRIGGMDPRDRLTQSIASEKRMYPGVEPPSDAQVAMVLHALADHTALIDAVSFSREGPWPEATSIGRWLHAYGDLFDLSNNTPKEVQHPGESPESADTERR